MKHFGERCSSFADSSGQSGQCNCREEVSGGFGVDIYSLAERTLIGDDGHFDE